jgi:hypothetical protein
VPHVRTFGPWSLHPSTALEPTQTRVPHLRRSFIAAKVGIAQSATGFL